MKHRLDLVNIIKQATEIYINDGDILVTRNGFYIDRRTTKDPETELNIILPICFKDEFYYYICCDCGEVHKTHITGKQQTQCCEDIDCERTQVLKDGQKAEYYLIKRQPIILDDYPLI